MIQGLLLCRRGRGLAKSLSLLSQCFIGNEEYLFQAHHAKSKWFQFGTSNFFFPCSGFHNFINESSNSFFQEVVAY